MCLPNFRFSLFMIGFLCFVRSEDLPSYNAEGECRNTLSETQTAGVIKFDGLAYLPDCLITVAPKKLDTGPGKVMMYFTEFLLASPCTSLNVTVLDGDDTHNAQPVKAEKTTHEVWEVSIYETCDEGLPNVLCERNTTLTQTGMVFNTTGSKFALLIRRKVYGVPATGSFVLKFSSFMDGPCPDVDNIAVCKSGRCTPSQFHCHASIDTCGWSEKEVCSKDEDTNTDSSGTRIWSTIIYILMGIIALIIFICLCVAHDVLKRLRNGIRRFCCWTPRPSTSSFRPGISSFYNTGRSRSRHTRDQNVNISVLSSSCDGHETGHSEAYSNRACGTSKSCEMGEQSLRISTYCHDTSPSYTHESSSHSYDNHSSSNDHGFGDSGGCSDI